MMKSTKFSEEEMHRVVQFFKILMEVDQRELITDHAKKWHAQKELRKARQKLISVLRKLI